MSRSIGFIGLGNMGLPIARNLLQKGFSLRVYNRSAEKADPLVALGAVRVSSPAETAEPGGIIFTMLADDTALRDVTDLALLQNLGEGGVHVSLSTVSPALVSKLSDEHRKAGSALLGAPVFGRPEAAAAGKLWVCLAGDPQARARVRPALDAIAQGVYEFGDEPHLANVVKLSGNFLLTAAIEAMAELSTFVEKNGLPRSAVLNMLTQTLFNCPIYTNYAKRVIDADFDKVGFTLQLALKDMTLAHTAAADAQCPMPILSLLCDRYVGGLAKKRGSLDASALALGAADDAGLAW